MFESIYDTWIKKTSFSSWNAYAKMTKKNFVVYVESSYDKEIYSKFMNPNVLKAIGDDYECDGKPKILKSVTSLNNPNVIGIVDADFDNILKNTYTNIYKTDYHDIENLMIHTPALAGVFNLFAPLPGFVNSSQLLKHLYEKTYMVACVRLLNEKNRLFISFKDISSSLLNKEDFKDIYYIIKAKKPDIKTKINQKDFIKECKSIHSSNKRKLPNMCRWHDMEYILSRDVFKAKSREAPIAKKLLKVFINLLISQYSKDLFIKTKLYKDLKKHINNIKDKENIGLCC